MAETLDVVQLAQDLVAIPSESQQSNVAIADFLESLKKAKFFSNVELQNVQSQDQEGVQLHKFTINLDVKYDF